MNDLNENKDVRIKNNFRKIKNNMRKIIISGNVVADATVFKPQNPVNNKIAIQFKVCVNEKYQQNGNTVEKSHFINCTYWRDSDKLAQYIKKGDKILVDGLPEASCYNLKSGESVAELRIDVRSIEFLHSKEKSSPVQTETTQSNKTTNHNVTSSTSKSAKDDDNDDLPF